MAEKPFTPERSVGLPLREQYARLKTLQHENFQLKVQVFMSELESKGKIAIVPQAKESLMAEFLDMKRQKEEADKRLAAMKAVHDELEQKNRDQVALPELQRTHQLKGEQDTSASYEELYCMTKTMVVLGSHCVQLEVETSEQRSKIGKLEEKLRTVKDEIRVTSPPIRKQKLKRQRPVQRKK